LAAVVYIARTCGRAGLATGLQRPSSDISGGKSMRPRLAIAAALCALLLGAAARSDDEPKKDGKLKAPTAAQLKIAQAITDGHAYEKHVLEEKLFPEVKSEKDFKELIAKVIANPTHHRKLENDREAYYDKPSNTIVIYNPRARDRGTCFRPKAGLKYFEGLK
jgi:hypothetical protein